MPERCDEEVYEKGSLALVTALRALPMEAWVTRVRLRSEQRVDWHYFAGRAVVKFIGDPVRVRDAIHEEAASLVDAVNAECAVFGVPAYKPGSVVATGYGLIPDITVPDSLR